MKRVEWTEAVAVGIGIVDAQHQNLFKYYNQLIEAVEGGHDAAAVAEVLERLKTYAVYHFDTEEGLMKKHGYPDVDEHQEAHQEYLEAIEEFDFKATVNDPAVGRDMVSFLTDWITRHIKTSDMEFAAFLAEGEKG